MKRYAYGILSLLLMFIVVGCADMSPTEQRVLSGSAIGAGAGAAIGAATGGNAGVGAAIGAGAGALGGLAVDQAERQHEYDTGRGYYENDNAYYGERDRGPGYYERNYNEEDYSSPGYGY